MPVHALVIDDDEFVRGTLVRQLRAVGAAEVLAAPDWGTARVRLDAYPGCNVVISDLDMPGAAGTAFLEELAAIRPGVALIIASALEPLVLQAIERHVRALPLTLLGCEPKPLALDRLRALLGAVRGD